MMEINDRIKKPLCFMCNKEMEFAEGDIIYGKKWYHRGCVQSKKHNLIISTQDIK